MLGSCDTDAILFGGTVKGPSIIGRHKQAECANNLATINACLPQIEDDVTCRGPNGVIHTA